MNIHLSLERLVAYNKPYMGAAELAEILDEAKQTIANWRRRGTNNVPQPLADLKMGPVWSTIQIRQWLAMKYLDGKKVA